MLQQTNPTPAVSNLSEERLAQLMNAGWRIDPATKNWTNPSGQVTQIPGSADPEVSGKDSGGEQISDQLQGADSPEINTEAMDKAYKEAVDEDKIKLTDEQR